MNEGLNNLIDDILKEKLKLHYENEELEAQGKLIKELCKEIERLKEQIEEYQKALDETMSEKIDLENIIKEAREYIHKTQMPEGYKWVLLEILDKENK